MNVVLLSPHFPVQHWRYARALKELGVNVIGLADEPPQFLPAHVRESLSDYVYVRDMHHYDELVRACGQITWKHGRIDRIDSLNEYWLEAEASLRTDFNVPGIKNDTIRQVKAKSEMKKVFQSLDIPVARGQVVDSLNQALAFARQVGYPVVLKPDVGVGAANTWRADDDETLIRLFQNKPDQPFILEEFIDGQILTYDGLTDRSGQPVFSASMAYSNGIMEAVNSDDHIYYYTQRQIPDDVEAYGRKMLKAFKVCERFFHFEFFRRYSDGQIVALEVNMRPPGGPSIDMFNFACDIDLYREWAHVMVHNHFNSQAQRKYFCMFAGRKDNKHYAHSHEVILHHYGPLMVEVGSLPPIFRQAMGDVYYLYRTEDEAEALEIANDIHLTE